MRGTRTQLLVEIALTIALAAVLDMLRLWRMPYGGSVSLTMLPIFVLAFRRGLLPGLAGGALYGVVDVLISPSPFVHWVQPFLDYPVAYMMVGLAGVTARPLADALSKRASGRAFALMTGGVFLGATGRYIVHWFSGLVFFGEYAPEGQPAWLYSALYNLYIPVSAVGCLIAAVLLVPALARIVPADPA
ncbi:MAG: energy-coupled thiamine transporter ThiT [Coriobacteriia bacterium]|jgi:thiamine transporter|nr:energy-coupled thiamine transporter ThiT [Coriobacteriia bacterium]